jgi:phosphoglycerate dehydrogenase-like enzyme
MKIFKKTLVTGFDRTQLQKETWKEIKELSQEFIFDESGSLQDVDCLFSKFNKVDKELINRLPNLRYIGILATGTGPVDIEYAKEKGITVTNIPGYCTESVAEFLFGVILEKLRNLEKAKQVIRTGDYSGDGFSATEIKGKKFGVVGLGRIGLRVAELAQAFGAEVSYWSRVRKPEAEAKGIVYQELNSLIGSSDFLSIHLQTSKETTEILNAERMALIKKGALVINVSGMELFNLTALKKRLQNGDIHFIFDHPDEMKKSDVEDLAAFPNCTVYSPIGYITEEAKHNKQAIFVENMRSFLDGKPVNVQA